MTREEYRRTVKSGGGFVFQVYGLDLLIDELYNDIYEKDR